MGVAAIDNAQTARGLIGKEETFFFFFFFGFFVYGGDVKGVRGGRGIF